MTLPNPLEHPALAALAVLHGDRGFSPTERQRTLNKSLLSAPCPPDDQYSGADRLTLPGGAVAELVIDTAREDTTQVRRLEPTNGYPVASRLPDTDYWRRNHG